VIGQVQIAGEAALAEGSLVRLLFEDYGSSALSARESHALALEQDAAGSELQARLATVRGDGWWYVDLPGKCWLVKAEFFPAVRLLDEPPPLAAALLDDPSIAHPYPRRPGDRRFVAQRDAIPSVQAIERPLEQGKLEISLAVELGLCAQGVVLDARTQERIVGAQVALKSMRQPCLVTTTLEDGSFRMAGIDARDLRPVDGALTFVVQLDEYATAQRETPWEEGQQGIVAFRVFLEPKER
jgi:hypothetical protein